LTGSTFATIAAQTATIAAAAPQLLRLKQEQATMKIYGDLMQTAFLTPPAL